MTLHVPLRPGLDAIPAQPLEIHRERVKAEWIDYNGHMNVAYYVLAFDHATDRLLDLLDLGVDYVSRENKSFFVLETHVRYLQEVALEDPLLFTLQLVDADAKRLHFYFEMRHQDEGFVSATSELIGMHVNLTTRRSEAFPDASRARIEVLARAQATLAKPEPVGASMAIRHSA